MKVNLSPQRREGGLDVVRMGQILIINGESFDFSSMGNGDTLPADAIRSPWFAGAVEMVDGELELTLFLPLPANFSPAQAFPKPLLNVPDGPVIFPQPLSDTPSNNEAEEL